MTYGTMAPSSDRSAVDPRASSLTGLLDRLAAEELAIPLRLLGWLLGGLVGAALAVGVLLALLS